MIRITLNNQISCLMDGLDFPIWKLLLQYCAKVMRVTFDEFRLLFSRIFDDMSAKFREVFRIAQCDISNKMRQNDANSFEISK